MYLTKKHLPRRTFLRGAGVTLALPFLESMVPAVTALAQSAARPKTRLVTIFAPHGWSPTYWADGDQTVALTEGRNVGLGFIHAPLKPWQDKLTIVSGLDATSAMPPPGSSGGDHSRASATFTGTSPKKTAGADIYGGVSIDQIVARKYGQDTLLPSIQLAIEAQQAAAARDQPAARVRAPVRRRHDAGGAAGAARRHGQRPRRGDVEDQPAAVAPSRQ
jgi:hypothetical protein